MHVLTKEEMYFFDKHTIEQIGIPGKELMENAGRGCAQFILNEILEPDGLKKDLEQSLIIFCGSGNNGGDGFVIARYIKQANYPVQLVLTGDEAKMSPETRQNYEKCRQLKINVLKIRDLNSWNKAKIDLDSYTVIVDAIFGVGFQGDVRGWYKDLFAFINHSESLKIAIDISSGIEANTGRANDAIRCDYTLTMASFKYGHFLGEGRERSGEVLVVDIGIPEKVYQEFQPAGKLITVDNVVFPERNKLSHKGSYGKIAIIAGSPGFSGAAIMASRAALRSGAGLIRLFHPPGLETIFETSLVEVMTQTFPKSGGEIDLEALPALLDGFDALLVGPGIGVSVRMERLLYFLLENWQKPMVLDADSLNIIAANDKLKQKLRGRLITPHIGEFARLVDTDIVTVQSDPVKLLKKFADQYKCNVLLKSASTVFSDGKRVIFDVSGNDGLATGGSGDVLAGIIVSFLGQKLDMENAAVSASYLLGTTAEKLAEIRKPASIIPTDVIEELFKY